MVGTVRCAVGPIGVGDPVTLFQQMCNGIPAGLATAPRKKNAHGNLSCVCPDVLSSIAGLWAQLRAIVELMGWRYRRPEVFGPG